MDSASSGIWGRTHQLQIKDHTLFVRRKVSEGRGLQMLAYPRAVDGQDQRRGTDMRFFDEFWRRISQKMVVEGRGCWRRLKITNKQLSNGAPSAKPSLYSGTRIVCNHPMIPSRNGHSPIDRFRSLPQLSGVIPHMLDRDVPRQTPRQTPYSSANLPANSGCFGLHFPDAGLVL